MVFIHGGFPVFFAQPEDSEGDWTLNVSKTATVIAMRDEGASATTRGLADKQRGLRGVACSEARPARSVPESKWEHRGRDWKASGSCTQRMEAVRTILEGQSSEEGQASHVHLLRARCCAVGTAERDVGATTLRVPGCEVCREELRVIRGEEPDRNKQKTSCVPGHCCRQLNSCTCGGCDGTRAGLRTRKTTTRWSLLCWRRAEPKKWSGSDD